MVNYLTRYDVLIHVLMMFDGMHNVVNVHVMYAIVNGLLYGLECEHMSIVDFVVDVALLDD